MNDDQAGRLLVEWPQALAQLGGFALRSRSVLPVVRRVVDLAAQSLAAPIVVATRIVDDGQVRVDGLHGPFALAVGEQIPFTRDALALWAGSAPLVVPDWAREERLEPSPGVRASGVRASMAVSVVPATGVWGRIAVHSPRPRSWRPAEVSFLQSVANVLAAAVDRERVESRLRDTADQLKRALLPVRLPALPGLEIAARYVAARGEDVGGDWYDAVALPDGAAGLVVGDVEGHGSTAAAVAGQVRVAMRAFFAEGQPPAEVVALTHAFVTELTDRRVGCCYAEVHPGQGLVTCVSAGHPAPVLVLPEGTGIELDLPVGPPLGAPGRPGHRERTFPFPSTASLVLATDGMLPRAPSSRGARLLSVAAALADRPLELLADRLSAAARARSSGPPGGAGPDGAGPGRGDAALVVARTTVEPAVQSLTARRSAARSFGSRPGAVAAARHFTADLLGTWGLGRLTTEAELAVSELVSNTLTHTTSAVRLTLRVEPGDGLWIGAYDASDRLPRKVRLVHDDDVLSATGRGLLIIDQLARHWGVTPHDEGGKTVWLELDGRTDPARGPALTW